MFFGLASLILGGITAAFGITTTIIQGQQAANKQREIASAQADSIEKQAEAEKLNQLQNSMRARKQSRMAIASAETQYAKSGVALEGTPAAALSDMAKEDEFEIIMAEAASGQKRQQLLVDAQNTRNIGYANASATSTGSMLQAVGIGLNAAGNAAWNGFQLNKYNEEYEAKKK